MKRITILKIAAGVAILVALFLYVGAQDIYSYIFAVKVHYILLALLIYPPLLLLGVLNYFILLRVINPQISFKSLIKPHLLSWAIGQVTPGKVGEFSIIYYLRKLNIKLAQGAVVSLLDKILTLVCLASLALIGALVFLSRSLFYNFLLFIVIGAISLLFLFSSFGRRLIRKYLLRSYAHKFKGFAKTMRHFVSKHILLLLVNLFLTYLKWIFSTLVLYLILLSLSIEVSFLFLVLIIAVIRLISLIPVTLSGLGVKEGAGVYLLSEIGVLPPVAMAAFVWLLISGYLTTALTFIFIKVEK